MKTPNLFSQLTHAAAYGDIGRVKQLVSQGIKVDDPDHDDRTAMTYAIITHNKKLVAVLVELGADVNYYSLNEFGFLETPLCLAAIENSPDITRILLKAGADPNMPAPAEPPLCAAGMVCFVAYQSKQELADSEAQNVYRLVEMLLDHGADVEILNSLGCSPLHMFTGCETESVIKLLLQRGADPVKLFQTDPRKSPRPFTADDFFPDEIQNEKIREMLAAAANKKHPLPGPPDFTP